MYGIGGNVTETVGYIFEDCDQVFFATPGFKDDIADPVNCIWMIIIVLLLAGCIFHKTPKKRYRSDCFDLGVTSTQR